MMLLSFLVSALIFGSEACSNCNQENNVDVDISGGRRRLEAHKAKRNQLCDAIQNIVKEETGPQLRDLFTHIGEDQSQYVAQAKTRVLDRCAKDLTDPDDNAQCQFYVNLLSSKGDAAKAAWLDAFGGEEDRQHGCATVVNGVNANLDKYAGANGPVEKVGANNYKLKAGVNVDKYLTDMNDEEETLIVRGLYNAEQRQTKQVELADKCTFMNGLTAAAITGASVVGVVLGHMCKAFEKGAYQAIESSPLI